MATMMATILMEETEDEKGKNNIKIKKIRRLQQANVSITPTYGMLQLFESGSELENAEQQRGIVSIARSNIGPYAKRLGRERMKEV